MWAEFEWENKVSVQSNITDMNQYLEHILTSTNMRCLTPKQVFVVVTVAQDSGVRVIISFGCHAP